MFSLFFNPKGRVKRLPFLGVFIASIVLMIVVLVVAIFKSVPQGFDGSTITAENAMNMIGDLMFLAIIVVVTFILYLWSQICVVFKRSRDFTGGVLFAVIYVALMFTPGAVLLLTWDFEFVTSQVSPTVNGLMLIMFFVLLFMPSKESQVDVETAEIFGNTFRSLPVQTAQAAMPPARKHTSAGLGRRTNTPAFGNR